MASSRAQSNHQILEEASAWFVDFRVGDTDGQAREEFNQWLRRSPDHIQAYFEVARTYAELPASSVGTDADMQSLIERARASATQNVIPLLTQSSARTPKTIGGRMLAAAAAVVLASIGAWLYVQRPIYSTAVGEQRSITLSDGSIVELNAASRIRVRFDKHERGIDLLAGQAIFRVAFDRAHPFIVASADTKIRALGTQFDVYRKADGTTVTVLEGKVAVIRDVSQVVFSAGEQATVRSGEPPKRIRANLAAATAWTHRELVFDNTPLADVAVEFNRYSTRRMTVSPAGLQDFHVSGVYSSANAESLLRFLRAQPSIAIQETRDEIRIGAK